MVCHTIWSEPVKSHLSYVEFLPFFHKFNTFTFYTPYLLFLDQLQNEGKRGFSIRFQNVIYSESILLIPHIYLFFYQKVNAVYSEGILPIPDFFYFSTNSSNSTHIFSHTCELIKITYSHALYIINHDSFIIFCRECFFLFVHYRFYFMIFRSN